MKRKYEGDVKKRERIRQRKIRPVKEKKYSYEPGSFDYKKNIYLLHTYGISLDEYNRLFEFQCGKCAICQKHQLEFKKKLSVDHNHSTEKVRGLLCQACNKAIGLFEEDTISLQSAIVYLVKNT